MGGSKVEGYDAHYAGTPLWDLGRPQRAMRELAEAGAFRGRVLEIGCGTGEVALLAAALGLPTVGIDSAPTAIETARRKAREQGLDVRFQVGDALELGDLGEKFDTVLDCALFHAFNETERVRYADSLATVMQADARLFVLCISDRHHPGSGPRRESQGGIRARRVSQDEIRATFADGWRVDSIEPAVLENTRDVDGAPGWLAAITRI
ncbi:class I SAM-dependent methyltransferase [Streptomyces stackebrandtii]|uniref:class I SAM-dependent methyltransferase n=1 Tax=Streptomyces stackebrandtii TaxID=3051177 RepID=UPI0028DB4DFF|nr:class I SAM-dependent methyltransferase [Streptomyces sp. DSM 40976]